LWRKLDREIVGGLSEVLLVCDQMGLIGREMFAVDGVKMPSNASKEWSGTREDFQKKAEKLERALGLFDQAPPRGRCCRAGRPDRAGAREANAHGSSGRLPRCAMAQDGKDRLGVSGKAVKSNITDPRAPR